MPAIHVKPIAPSGTGETDATAAAWCEHRDTSGFTLVKPESWRLRVQGPGDFVVADPRGSAAALVRRRWLPPGAELASWLRQGYAGTEPGLHNVRVLRVRAPSPSLAMAAFDYGSEVFGGRASVVATRHGDAVMLFVAAAASERFASSLPCLARILGSVRVDPHAGGRSPAVPVPGLDLPRLLRIGIGI